MQGIKKGPGLTETSWSVPVMDTSAAGLELAASLFSLWEDIEDDSGWEFEERIGWWRQILVVIWLEVGRMRKVGREVSAEA